MTTDINKLIDKIFASDSEGERSWLKNILSPKNKIKRQKILIALQERNLDSAMPFVLEAKKIRRQRIFGGKNSGLSESERIERNVLMQQEVNQLCKKGKSFRGACQIIGKKHGLHPDYLKKILCNPKKLGYH